MTNSNSNPATATVTNVTAYAEQRQPDRHGAGISPPDATIISASIAAVIIVLGWVVNNCQILRRDREARAYSDRNAREDRLRNYEGFLVEKEQIAEASSTESIHQMYFAQDGLLNAGHFRKEAIKVRRDFSPKKRVEFDLLDDALGRMSPDGLSREKLAEAIRSVRKFIRAT